MVSSTSVAVADLDGDGSDDIAVADAGFPGPPNDPGGVCILLNDGSGVFAQSGLLGAGIAPDDVQVADLTGDGEPDLAVASEAWYLAILPGRTGGSFGAAMNFGLMGAPLALVNGDFDGDTLRDLLVVSSSGAFVLTNQSEAPPELIIDARVSLDNPRGLGSGTLAWTTNTERDLTGFNVVVFIDDRRQQLNRAVIPCAECTTGGGAAYSFTVPIRHVWRRLYIEAIHLDGTLEIFGPARRHLPRRR
jgi:hypothetical protein